MQTFKTFREFDRPVQVALANMLANNTGFYMLIPFLSVYMANGLGLAVWIVGLVLGIRVLSQQCLALVGGSIADRIGYKTAMVIAAFLRTIAFALFGLADGPLEFIAGVILTGFGGALGTPAVRAYLSHGSGKRRVEAFALLDVTQHVGTLLGPLLGAALITVDFRYVCFGAASSFAVLTFLQLRFLPESEAETISNTGAMLRAWGHPLTNRPFLLFNASILGYFTLINQLYLGLPLEAQRVTGTSAGVGLMFGVLALAGIFGQLPIATLAQSRLRATVAMALGLGMMGAAFAPLMASATLLPVPATATEDWLSVHGVTLPTTLLGPVTLTFNVTPLIVSCLVLMVGQMLAAPFVLATVTAFSDPRLVGTYFGVYGMVQGFGAVIGNIVGGGAFDLARTAGLPWLPWALMVALGLICAISIVLLERAGTFAGHTPDGPPVVEAPVVAVAGSAGSER